MKTRIKRIIPGDNARMLLVAALIGVLAGLGSIVFRTVVEAVKEHVFLRGYDFFDIGAGGWRRIFTPFLPMSGMVLMLPLLLAFPGEVGGYGFTRFLRRVNLEGARLSLRTVFLTILSTAFTMGTGGSAGVEGPTALIGGTLGSQVGTLLRVSGERMKVLTAAGCAGGVAAMFNAPIAGIFFAAEIVLLGTYEISSFASLVIAAAIATVVSRGYYGEMPAFSIPAYHLVNPLVEIPLYCLMGVVAGIAAVLHIRLFYLVRDRIAAIKAPRLIKPVAGAFVVGTMGIFFPQIMGDGYDFIEKVLSGEGSLALVPPLVFLKMAATAITLGAGGAGGVFAPSLFIGAMLGGSFGAVVHSLFPSLTASSGVYATVGIGAFLASATHAPLTAIFLLFEMTGNYLIIIPVMVSSIVGVMVTTKLSHDSIDTVDLSREGIDVHAGREVALMQSMKVGGFVSTEVDLLSEAANIDQLLAVFATARDSFYFPVVNESGRMTGIVSLQDVKTILHDEKLRRSATVAEVCSRRVAFLTIGDTLHRAFEMFDLMGIEEIPVVESDEERWVIGMLKRRDAIAGYNREMVRRGIRETGKVAAA